MKQNSESFEIADEIDFFKKNEADTHSFSAVSGPQFCFFDDDVKNAFPTSKSVNSALRRLMTTED